MSIQNVTFVNPEPITLEGIKTSNPKLLRIYTNKSGDEHQFDPVAKKTQGTALGTIYKKHHQLDLDKKWMGKVGNPREFLDNGDDSDALRSQKGINLDTIFEKIAYDLYQELGKELFEVPKTLLSFLPLFNDFTNDHVLVRLYQEDLEIDSSLRIMSQFGEGYHDLREAQTQDGEKTVSFLDYLAKYHRPPESIVTQDGRSVPIEGLMGLLAVGRCLADGDLLGGSGRCAGFRWIHDKNGKIQSAKVIKIDPGYAFVFSNDADQPKEPCENWVVNTERNLGSTKYHLEDLKDIQTSTSNVATLVTWESLTPNQKNEFLGTLHNISQYLEKQDVLDFFFYREGRFYYSDLALIPQEVALKTQEQMTKWIQKQLEIYAEPLEEFLFPHVQD